MDDTARQMPRQVLRRSRHTPPRSSTHDEHARPDRENSECEKLALTVREEAASQFMNAAYDLRGFRILRRHPREPARRTRTRRP